MVGESVDWMVAWKVPQWEILLVSWWAAMLADKLGEKKVDMRAASTVARTV